MFFNMFQLSCQFTVIQRPIHQLICMMGKYRNEVKRAQHGLTTSQIVNESHRMPISTKIMAETKCIGAAATRDGYRKVIVILIKSIQTY